jgi:hypothetical protein
MKNKLNILQAIIVSLGILGTTTLSFMYLNPLIYLVSMTIFGVYNLLQTIHFYVRKLWWMVGLFIYFLVIGIYGYVNFIITNIELIKVFLNGLV